MKRIRISQATQGHNGPANGGNFGSCSEVFGIFSDSAITINDEEEEGSIHKDSPNWHQDKWEKSYCVHEEYLRPGDFIAIEHKRNGQIYNSSGGDIEILSHRLPIGAEVPKGWGIVGGVNTEYMNSYVGKTTWVFLRVKNGGKVDFEEACKELGLQTTPHPYGNIWTKDLVPVAVNGMPKWSGGGESSGYDFGEIFGDLKFFAKHGFVVLQNIDGGDDISCSQEICLHNLKINNLHEEGWFPVEISKYFVLWGTGLCLYPKHLAWQFGLDPAAGKSREDGRGTRIFDSSPKRLEKVQEFFLEAVGVRTIHPKEEYIRWANHHDPKCGSWQNSYQYPDSWSPHFKGWGLKKINPTECRWKQPAQNKAFYYGLVK